MATIAQIYVLICLCALYAINVRTVRIILISMMQIIEYAHLIKRLQ